MIRTELDDLADAARTMLQVVAPLVGSGAAEANMTVEQGADAVEGTLALLILYCRAAEVDFDAALIRARGFATDYWKADLEMQGEA